MVQEKSVRQFDKDVRDNKGYLYTQTDQLSSRLANQRWQVAMGELVDLKGKRVLDLGCGDGTYTLKFLEQKPAFLMGVDASKMAIRLASRKAPRVGRSSSRRWISTERVRWAGNSTW
jgi:2-polyprenyl-3-methyl-5-hydroxy-6-metoxy-1,4-benzoquinol methylase